MNRTGRTADVRLFHPVHNMGLASRPPRFGKESVMTDKRYRVEIGSLRISDTTSGKNQLIFDSGTICYQEMPEVGVL